MAAVAVPWEPRTYGRMRAAWLSLLPAWGGNYRREHLGCSSLLRPLGRATGSALSEGQLNPIFRQKSLLPGLFASISLSGERIPYLKDDLPCELVAEVSLAIKICAEGAEAPVISIHGVS